MDTYSAAASADATMTNGHLEQYCIFRCRAGSYAYGTNLPTSDIDERGVFIAPPSHVVSCIQTIEQIEDKQKDVTIYELRKFMKLAANCNPNIIELLFTEEENILEIHPAWERIRKHRNLFLSKKAKHTFSGYAMRQLKRIKGHHKWISQDGLIPKQHPVLGDYCKLVFADGSVTSDPKTIRQLSAECFIVETFGKTQFRVFSSPQFFADKLGFFTSDELQLRPVNVHDDILKERAEYVGFLIVNLNEFKKDYKVWKDFWAWKQNRNEVRAKLEEQYGFDTKHAMHLVRLMRMAQEIIRDGKVVVRRPDAEELLRIRNGEFDYQRLINWSEEMDKSLNELYESSDLPYSPDYQAIDQLYREVVFEFWKDHNLI